MKKYIMSIDQGTTSTRTIIVDQAGGLVAEAQQSYRQIFPKPGWVEHDLEDIWFSTTYTMKEALKKAKIHGHQIAGIGITNQRETVGIWDRKTSKPLANAIVWQCRRTQAICEKLRKLKKQKMIADKTGLVLDPYFSASKIQWLLKNTTGAMAKAKANQLVAGTIDSFLLWRLSAGEAHRTDVSNASRTMLMNLKTLNWDLELLKLFGVPKNILPEIMASSGEFGRTKGLGFLPDGIVISGIAGDQQAALFGQACFATGESKCTFGTGSFLLLNTGSTIVKSKSSLLTTVAWQLKGEKPVYALEGGAFVCGAAVQWLRDGLGIIEKSSDIETLAASVADTQNVEFVPALTGLGAPHWKPEARGIITGLTRGTTKAHIARATLEAMALQNTEILLAMQKDLGKKLKSVKVDGGASANNLLMQLQADYLGNEVVRPKILETTALGAAFLAGLGCGYWSSPREIVKIWNKDKSFESQMKTKERQQRLLRWQKAVKKAE